MTEPNHAKATSRINRILARAERRARAERTYFKEVVVPARMAEIAREITAELQTFAPGCEFTFGLEDSEVYEK